MKLCVLAILLATLGAAGCRSTPAQPSPLASGSAPTPPPPRTNIPIRTLATIESLPTVLAADDRALYFDQGRRLISLARFGDDPAKVLGAFTGTPQAIATNTTSVVLLMAAEVPAGDPGTRLPGKKANRSPWPERTTAVWRFSKEGGNGKQEFTLPSDACCMAADDKALYWIEGTRFYQRDDRTGQKAFVEYEDPPPFKPEPVEPREFATGWSEPGIESNYFDKRNPGIVRLSGEQSAWVTPRGFLWLLDHFPSPPRLIVGDVRFVTPDGPAWLWERRDWVFRSVLGTEVATERVTSGGRGGDGCDTRVAALKPRLVVIAEKRGKACGLLSTLRIRDGQDYKQGGPTGDMGPTTAEGAFVYLATRHYEVFRDSEARTLIVEIDMRPLI